MCSAVKITIKMGDGESGAWENLLYIPAPVFEA